MANRFFNIANLVLLTAAIYLGVNIFYTLLGAHLDGGSAPLRAASPEPVAAGDFSPGGSDYQVIVERNLFNSSRQAMAEAAGAGGPALDLEKLKQTELKLKLWGTVTGADGQTYAVIEDQKSREQLLYRPGDSIQNAAIRAVLREKVVLTVNGRDEVLAQEVPGVTRSGPPGPGRADAGMPPRIPPAESAQQVTIKGEQIEQAMENLTDLMSQATFRPHTEDGKPAGISITGIKPNAVFRKLRLRNGDVITGVNGQAIASVEDAMKVFGTLSSEGPIQVKVKRRGQEETLEYRVE